jgi:hypothetical protein
MAYGMDVYIIATGQAAQQLNYGPKYRLCPADCTRRLLGHLQSVVSARGGQIRGIAAAVH